MCFELAYLRDVRDPIFLDLVSGSVGCQPRQAGAVPGYLKCHQYPASGTLLGRRLRQLRGFRGLRGVRGVNGSTGIRGGWSRGLVEGDGGGGDSRGRAG